MIRVSHLQKEFRIHQARAGLAGAFRDLFSREYKTVKAVDDISFTVEEGEMFALIGENGAGKSTTIKMLTGILTPSGGEIVINGYVPYRQREQYVRSIGVVFGQRSQLWWDLSPLESFRLLKNVYKVDDTEGERWLERLIEELDIASFVSQPVRKLSLGQRMRCEVAAALIHKPKLLFLDEPTVGLDVLVKQKIREFLRNLNETEHTTILLTTHDVSDIEALCKRVLVMDQGRLIFDGQLTDLKEKWGNGTEVAFQFKKRTAPEEMRAALGELPCEILQDNEFSLRVKVARSQEMLPFVLSVVMGSFEVSDVKIKEASTEDIVRNIYSTDGEVVSHG
ncbi:MULTISPECIES: ATP-binding cassette domain-containing protein [Bacillales]|jgi:ABC-2 type transport system ATP-binding protein|uniref:Daunorubicin ABC transporter ATP-binding protein n=1 Tax=Brevibacillus aydinogluensis TaxID=927786 RepID=A0AA48M9X8_9BACL|nr:MULTISPECIES: ATP-binding cassette domain-containing protein [Bacillales]REK66715.1 MAG: daunorubicin ABC transporter ATP-binding protein [Brevibacillus sp.]MBR8660057.1 ATP-binding cassette domain-containing protein [Brevibacillus sp. NL20B1]MDT3417781.1 ABC-2 type transport system ATP-binding protein [Brevibacillus aydinogluensis]NNV02204.1 ATP-binding cassette domain-containing protein [Brevibacillus sp. MCWH]UFJ62872.1 ATP-binding cassette domain-containing protein [Anoxybacillus sedimi